MDPPSDADAVPLEKKKSRCRPPAEIRDLIAPQPLAPPPQPDSSASLQSTTKIPPATSTLPIAQRPVQPEGVSKGFDVYSRPFIPQAQLDVNSYQPVSTIDTPAVNKIDFVAYFRNTLPFDFLPRVPQSSKALWRQNSLNQAEGVYLAQYEQYFTHHLEAEMLWQQWENESYSLFMHDATVSPTSSNSYVTFKVPGLQENSPYVEEDDIVQLREVYYEQVGYPPQSILRWHGTAYNGRVANVKRKDETLLLKVQGLVTGGPRATHLNRRYSNLSEFVSKFNIQFPVPKERFTPMFQSLPIVQQALRTASFPNTTSAVEALSIGAQDQFSAQTNGADKFSQQNKILQSHNWFRSMLFPSEADCKEQISLNKGSTNRLLFDAEINWEQLKVIKSVCEQDYGTVPFLVSGPPGTGKTKTLVELAVQLVQNNDGVSHILFCAPSDPAADTLIKRLSSYFNPTQLFRLNRTSRAFAEVPDAVMPFCYVAGDTFTLPPFKQLMAYGIVVTTCRDASLIMYARMTNADLFAVEQGLRDAIHPNNGQKKSVTLHWTALLIDEAAQAKEPEALIPLCVVAPPWENVKLSFTPLLVMAGDEHQLGPRVSLPSSPLKVSLFARLFALPVYANHPLARNKSGKPPPVLTQAMLPMIRPPFVSLIGNYRSHPAILAIPSALFYADTLVAKATETDRLASWPGWRGRKWPVLFHNNASSDDLEADNGGWYNRGEANIARDYAVQLVETGLVEPQEVCIMSPFKAQVQRLRKRVRGDKYSAMWNVDIGPTEIFQGLERGVVIICTTRSKARFVEKDKELGWGLIGMPNKMNVALTRAKFGLIVIGNSVILRHDPDWRAFLDFCERNGLMAGETESLQQPLDRKTGNRATVDRRTTILENGLLFAAQNAEAEPTKGSRVLGGRVQDDVMWTTGMDELSSMQGSEDDDYEED